MEGTMLPSEVQEFKLNKIKTVLRFGNSDVAEAQFPSGPLRMAAHRRMMSKVKPGSFVSTPGAEAEVSDPYLAYGQPPLPVKHLQPLKGSRRVTHGPAGSERLHGSTTASSTFLTQGLPGSGAGEGSAGSGDEVHHGTSPLQGPGSERYAGEQEGPSDGSDSEEPGIDKQGSSAILPNGMPAPAHARGPGFQPLTVPAVPMRGDEDNPVYTWHNHFVKVRHAGRAALQQALWERAEGRFRARTVGPMAANLSSILMADLDIVRGQQQPYASPGSSPLSPYVKMDASWEALQKRAQVAARAAQQLDPEELRVLQRFYDQLCALVEAQRMSDPLSLMVIHKVKSLLEGGTFLQRTMTVAVVQHLAHFAKSTGIVKYNKFMLSILTFICKCTGVTEAEFEELVKEAGLSQASQGKRSSTAVTHPDQDAGV
ncbi:uncharacterized protein HaLaN_07357 [Haematococcus lacustris]|uniref:Uncharacterized protein n=1 Tax=Haematococcus lacustris TaxID=44745 RepID=A0A699YYW5_HAELA|nr:uncharacterized protein HaLaN_07357 [Haematococcus lacustris]